MHGMKRSGLSRKRLPPPRNPGCFQRFDELLGDAPRQPRYDRLPVRVTYPDSPPVPSTPQQDRLDVPERNCNGSERECQRQRFLVDCRSPGVSQAKNREQDRLGKRFV